MTPANKLTHNARGVAGNVALNYLRNEIFWKNRIISMGECKKDVIPVR